MRLAVFLSAMALVACGPTAAPAPATTTSTSVTAAPTGANAKPATPSAQTPTGWDRDLLALLPQIDACIAKTPDAREITYADERNGAVFVRLSSPENNFDCNVRGGVAQISRRDEALSVDGENSAIFVRGPGENPGGECYQAPEVHDTHGALVGWMIDPEGC
jgi:hypothetical protein